MAVRIRQEAGHLSQPSARREQWLAYGLIASGGQVCAYAVRIHGLDPAKHRKSSLKRTDRLITDDMIRDQKEACRSVCWRRCRAQIHMKLLGPSVCIAFMAQVHL